MSSTGGGIQVEIRLLASPARILARGTAPLGVPAAGVTRNLALATYSGERPDLFVLDRGIPGARPRLSIYSGESRFRRQLLMTKLPISGLGPKNWVVDVGLIDGSKPDLLLVTREGASGQAELHVLPGENGYQAFSIHRPLGIRGGVAGTRRFVFGSSRGPAIYAVDTGHPRSRVRIIPLTAQPPD
jgi:hypothetical protein